MKTHIRTQRAFRDVSTCICRRCTTPIALNLLHTPTTSSHSQAAFHGSADAAKVLLDKSGYDGISRGLHKVADKEGKDAITHAKDEGNADVVKVIEAAALPELGDGTAEDGLRKRK